MKAPNQILTASQMKAAEQALFDGGETPESLMERAGTGAADWIWRLAAGRRVSVLCGPGNNGGDGYVIARVLAERGVDVSVIAPLEPATDAARAAREKWGGTPVSAANGAVFVDCLFGTGLGRPLSDELLELLQGLAKAHDLSIAIDCPSGVESDSGDMLNQGLPHYDLTIALGVWKYAHWLMPSADLMGERRLVDIGVEPVSGATQLARRPRLAAPAVDSHKYSRGLVAVIGGDMPGAGVLSATAAQHSGAGYVKLAAPHAHPALPADIVMDESGSLNDLLGDERLGAALIGPGLGRDEKARAKLEQVLSTKVPAVLDADALAILTPDMALGDASRLLATPHAGELATLCERFGINEGRQLARARALHEATGITVLAKGPGNILAGQGGTTLFPPTPSWLSTAGTGDVLAGICASRMAHGRSASEAAQESVVLHGEAARIAGVAFSASDLVAALPKAYAAFL